MVLLPALPRKKRPFGAAAAWTCSAVVEVLSGMAAVPVPMVMRSSPVSLAETMRVWPAMVAAKRSSSVPVVPLSLISSAAG